MNGSDLVALASLTTLVASVSPTVQAQELAFWLANGESELVQTHFTAGETITANCSENCLDLDLFLYDAKGNLIAQDTELDVAPTLLAPYNGNFMLEVFMPNCIHPEGCTAWVSSKVAL